MLSRIIFVIIAYLLGSIPFGYLLIKYVFTKGEDVRRTGSGGTGATNVTRRAGLKGGLLTLLFDVAKGAAAAALMRVVASDDYLWIGLAAIAAVIGHIFPVFLKFRGGKGVATGLGICLVIAPVAVLMSIVAWAVIVYVTRYVSLGSIAAAATMPLWAWLFYGYLQPGAHFQALIIIAAAAGALIIASHNENIGRLIRGTESKMGQKTESDSDPAESDRAAVSGGRN